MSRRQRRRLVLIKTVKGGGGAAIPWTPTDLGAALKAWWNADDHGTANMTDDGAGLISNWKDRTSAITTTATTTARPTWASNSVNSAYAGVTFDGTANCLTTTSFAALPTGTTGGTIFVLASQLVLSGSTGGTNAVAYGTTATANQGRIMARAVVTGVNRFRANDVTTQYNDTFVDLSGVHAFAGIFAEGGTTLGGRVDGYTAAATASATNTVNTRLRIGSGAATAAASFWNGPIRHVIVTTTLTLDQQQRLEAWLLWEVGSQSILIAGHPYKDVRP